MVASLQFYDSFILKRHFNPYPKRAYLNTSIFAGCLFLWWFQTEMLGTELAVSMDICKGDCIAFCIFVHSVGHSFRGLVFTLDFIFISKDGCRPEKRDPCSSPPCKRLKQGNYGKVFICVQSQTLEKLVIQNYISLSCIFAISLVPFLVMSSNSVKTAKYNMRSIIYI